MSPRWILQVDARCENTTSTRRHVKGVCTWLGSSMDPDPPALIPSLVVLCSRGIDNNLLCTARLKIVTEVD